MKKAVKYIIIGLLEACSASKTTSEEQIPVKSSLENDYYGESVKNWEFKIYEKSFEVQIIEYYPTLTRCNRVIINALAIVKTEFDTIRVIDKCPGNMDYKNGDKLIFEPDDNPPTNNFLGLAYVNGEPNPSIFKNREVKTTTFGYLKNKN